MKSGMYNREIFWPDDLEEAVQDFFSRKMTICRTEHYDQRAQEYGVNKGAYRTALSGKAIEVTVSGGCIVKAVTRVSNRKKEGQDMIFPISFCWDPYLETFVAIVKTVWENNSEDHHPTKDIKKYVQS